MHNKEGLQERHYEQPYHWMLRRNDKGLYELRSKTVKKLLEPLKGKKILDVGCGDGKFTSALARETETIGIDFSENAIRFAKCLVPEASFLVMNATQMEFPDANFDVVTCLDVIEHLPGHRVKKVIDEIYRVLKPEGVFIISVPSKRMPLVHKHYRHYSYSEVCELFKARFEVMGVSGCGRYFPFLLKYLNLPLIWKVITKYVVKKCIPSKAITLIIQSKKVVRSTGL